MSSKPSLLRLLPLYVVTFFGFVGYSMMITLFTPLFMEESSSMVNGDASMAYRIIMLGAILALYPLAQFFGSPILGALSDREGRKPLLRFSLLVVPFCYALIAYSIAHNDLYLLMLGCLSAGLLQANIVIAQSAIADVTTKSDRSRYFGYIYLSSSAGFIAGPLLGGWLSDKNVNLAFNYATPFWVVCVLLAITYIWTELAFKETKVQKDAHITLLGSFTNLFSIFTSKKLRVIYLINFLLYFAVFGFFRCYPMYIVNQYHPTVTELSLFIAWVSAPIILVNLGITGHLSKRFSARSLTIWAGLLLGVFTILVTIPSSPQALWITLLLPSSTIAICLPATSTMLSLAATDAEQGRVMGNNQALQVGAEASSAFIGGLLASYIVELSLISLAVLAFIAVGILVLGPKITLKQRKDTIGFGDH